MAELTLEESVKEILPTLPLPFQKFFQERRLGEEVRLLTERYVLHIDQGAILERELTAAILGLKSPEEFAADLYEQLPVSKQTILDIMADVNTEVFVPLREEEMKSAGVESGSVPQPGKPSAPPTPVSTGSPFSAVPKGRLQSYAPPLQSPKYFREESPLPPLRPIKVGLNTGRPSALTPTKPPANIVPTPGPAVQGAIHMKPMDSSKLLEDHEEPHIDISRKVQGVSLPVTESPLRQALRTVVPSANNPINTQPRPTPPMPPLPVPPIPPRAVPLPVPPAIDLSVVQKEVAEVPIPAKPIPPGARFTPPSTPKIDLPVPPTAPLPQKSAPASEASGPMLSVAMPPKPSSSDPYREPIE